MASGTRVDDGHDHARGRVGVVPDLHFVSAQWVVVGVAGVVQLHRAGRERGDVVGVLVLVPAGAKADAWGVECSVAFVDGGGLCCEGEDG